MKVTLERYRACRETRVPICGGAHHVTVRRPTELAVARAGGIGIDFAIGCVVGWDLTVADLVAGGEPEPADFDAAVFAEWIADKPGDWRALVDAVSDAYQAHKDAADERGNA